MPNTETKRLIERRKQVVARGVGMFTGEMSAKSGRGALLVDADGREFLDFAGGIGVVNAGHCPPQVVAAIQKQAETLLHTCIHVASYEPYVALCEQLTRLFPHGGTSKAMLVNSGAEAVENAVKIARQATGRPAVLCYEGGFHGRTLLGMTLTAKSAYKKNCGPFAPEVYRLPYPHYSRQGGDRSEEEYARDALVDVRRRFTTGPVPASHVAAIVIEVVQGEGGFVAAPMAYLRGLRELCDEFGILLICDEVQSGFGRAGAWAAYQHAGIEPDLATWAKAMGGGLPIGAVTGRAEIMDRAEPGTIGGTYGGNPVACAAALANIATLEEEKLIDRAVAIGKRTRDAFADLMRRSDLVHEIRGLGAMLAIECCVGGDPEKPATAEVAQITAACRENGLLILTAGPFGNIIRTLAPLTISDAELDRGLGILSDAVMAVTG